jgi:DNA repair protein RadC
MQEPEHDPEEVLRQACRRLIPLFPPRAMPPEGPPVRIVPPPRPGRRSRPRRAAVRVLPEDLRRPAADLWTVLLHGMVHFANGLQGVKDCSRGHYHNLRFRRLAEQVGLRIGEGSERFGWAATTAGEALRSRLEELTLPRLFDPTPGPPVLPPEPLPPLPPPAAPPPSSPPNPPPVRPPRPVPVDEEPAGPEPLLAREWRCGLNLEPLPPTPWEAPPTAPEVPRFRLSLVREGGVHPARYPRLQGVEEAAALCWQLLQSYDREALVVLYLDAQRRLIGYSIPYVGTLREIPVEPRGVLVPALMANAASVVVGHNHPSGDPNPSLRDRHLCQQLVQAGEILGVEVAACLVLGGADRWRRISPVGLDFR